MGRAQITYWNPVAQKKFGDNLFAFRESLNLTQQEFAEKLIAENDLPYSRSYVSDLEIGATPPSQKFLESVYFAFDKDWNDLLPIDMPFEKMHRGRNPATPHTREHISEGGKGSGVPHVHPHGHVMKNRKGTSMSNKAVQMSPDSRARLYRNVNDAMHAKGIEKNVDVIRHPLNRGFITPSGMSDLANARKSAPNRDVLIDLANVLGTSVDDLLEGTGHTYEEFPPATMRRETLERVVSYGNGDSGTAQETEIGVQVTEPENEPTPQAVEESNPVTAEEYEEAMEQSEMRKQLEARTSMPTPEQWVGKPAGITLRLVDGELTIVYPNGLSIVTRSFDGTITL
ncbi:MAG TPA: helix-turn-helix transcriptional regulator [Candidatus Saccharimonadales bacterium]|nr:helix-turn-helix transcriptional regulator [Candidatus Saccharimonadales bacterium]